MAATLVASTSAGGNVVSIVLDVPAGTLDGDLLVVFISANDQDVLTPPAGWTQLRADNIFSGSSSTTTWVYQRRASSEPADYTWTFNTNHHHHAICATWRGARWITTSDANTATSGTTISLPSLTAATDDILVGFGFAWSASSLSWPPSTLTTIRTQSGTPELIVASEIPGAGATSTYTLTSDNSGRMSATALLVSSAEVTAEPLTTTLDLAAPQTQATLHTATAPLTTQLDLDSAGSSATLETAADPLASAVAFADAQALHHIPGEAQPLTLTTSLAPAEGTKAFTVPAQPLTFTTALEAAEGEAIEIAPTPDPLEHFPAPLDMRVEMAFGADLTDPESWTWTDVSEDLDPAAGVRISHGRAEGQDEIGPSSLRLTLDNRSGDYTPDQPLSPYYPYVRRGVPIRLRTMVPTVVAGLVLPGADGSYASTPDHASLDITGDLDVRAEITPESWHPPEAMVLASKYQTSGDERSWMWRLLTDGRLELSWSPDGTFGNLIARTSTTGIPDDGVRRALRATLEVDDAGAHTVLISAAPSVDGPWTQLGDPLTEAGVTSIHASAAPLEWGAGDGGTGVLATTTAFEGQAHRLQIRDGIDGSVVADADVRDLPSTTATYTDSVGRVWSLHGNSVITDPRERFSGHVASWAPTWPRGDLSTVEDAGEAWVEVSGAGIMRRMGQSATPTVPAPHAIIPTLTDVTNYWPLDDGAGTRVGQSLVSPGDAGGGALGVHAQWGAYELAPHLGAGVAIAGGSFASPRLIGNILYTGPTTEHVVDVVVRHDSGSGDLRMQIAAQSHEDQPQFWEVHFLQGADGDDQVQAVARTSTGATEPLGTSDIPGFFAGRHHHVRVRLAQISAGSPSTLVWVYVDGAEILAADTAALNRITVPYSTGFHTSDSETRMVLGHLVYYRPTAPPAADVSAIMDGFPGELATDRMLRLASEGEYPLRIIGEDTLPIGPQQIAAPLDVIQSAALVDGGLVYEQGRGLVYRTGRSLTNQPPRLALDADAEDISIPLHPALDDEQLTNDVNASRPEGGSAHIEDAAHVTDHGRYDTSITRDVSEDRELIDQAGWRLHLGTWPQMRYPTLTPALRVRPQLLPPWLHMRLGDQITLTGLPPQHPLDTVALLMQGYAETITPHDWQVDINASPAGPYTVGHTSGEQAPSLPNRADTAGSELTVAVDDSATSLSVATTQGPIWTTDVAQLPLDIRIGGETIRVTAISGESSPQVFTVVRSINDVVKGHPAGADVRLAVPAIIGL